MHKIKSTNILVYYDGPQLFEGQDIIGTHYLCMLCETKPIPLYLVIQISIARLTAIKNGLFDVSAAYRQPELGTYWTMSLESETTDYIARPISLKDIPKSWFPDSNLYIHCPDPLINLVKMAQDHNTAIVELNLYPEESKIDSKIGVEKLTTALKTFQRLITQSYGKALAELDKATKKTLDKLMFHQLNVRAFMPGSFKVLLETEARADMLGYVQVAKALDKIDMLHSLIHSPEDSVDYLHKYHGHFASAYKDLIRFVVETKTPFSYQWAMPCVKSISTHLFIPTDVEDLYKILMSREDISTENVVISGFVVKVDLPYRSWRILDDETGREVRGKILPESDLSLEGITVGTQKYEFNCIENIEEEKGTGKEHRVLYLTKYNKL